MNAGPLSHSRAVLEDVVAVRPPDLARLYAGRAARCRALAAGNPLSGYLTLLAAIASAQDTACREMPVAPTAHSVLWPVPLAVGAWPRGCGWRHALDGILHALTDVPMPPESAAAVFRLRGMSNSERERLGTAVLALAKEGVVDPAAAVFVAAALQVYWSTLAALLSPGLPGMEGGGLCPICGSPPGAGVVLGDRSLRYLVCWLCSTSWHLTRLVCSGCGSTADLSYLEIGGGPPGVKAEACGRCRRYLKLFYLEMCPAADVVADDVATLALDMLMADEGFARAGVNTFLSLPR